MTGPRVTAPPRPPRPGHGPGRPGARRGGRGTRGSARHGPERGSAQPGRSCARRRPLGAAGRAVPSSPGNFGLGAPGGLEIPEHSRPPPPGVLARALPGSSGAPHVPYFPLGSTEGFAPRRPRPPVPLRVPVPLRCHEPFPSQTCSAARLKLPAETPGFPRSLPHIIHPAQGCVSHTGMSSPSPSGLKQESPRSAVPKPTGSPLDKGISPGLCRVSSPLPGTQRGAFPLPRFNLHSSPCIFPPEVARERHSLSVFSLPPSHWFQSGRGSPRAPCGSISHHPSTQHWMLPADPSKALPAAEAHNAHPLLLTEEEEVGLSNPFSPSMATGTASTTHRSSAGAKVCLTTQNHRRLLAKGQDQGRAYGHAPHFFSLTNEKKKKSHI